MCHASNGESVYTVSIQKINPKKKSTNELDGKGGGKERVKVGS